MRIEVRTNSLKDPDRYYTNRILAMLEPYRPEITMPSEDALLSEDYTSEGDAPELLLVLGGDGSIMRAAHRAAALKVPILGINLGRIGYLAEINLDELEPMLERFFKGQYRIERRMMLDVSVISPDSKTEKRAIALNDAVLSHGQISRLLRTEILCNDESLGHYYSDGFVVSTPTGSTAYSLAAGGPVMAPSLNGICLTPLCPHSLTSRPILVPDTSDIVIRYLCSGDADAYLTADGIEVASLDPGDSVLIRRSKSTADFIRIDREEKKSFYDILREKMSEV